MVRRVGRILLSAWNFSPQAVDLAESMCPPAARIIADYDESVHERA
jgi:hypothetical protein